MLQELWKEKFKYLSIILVSILFFFSLSFLTKITYSSSALLKPNDFRLNQEQNPGFNLGFSFTGLNTSQGEVELAVETLRSKDFFASLLDQEDINLKERLINMNNLNENANFDILYDSFHRNNLDIFRNTDNEFIRVSVNFTDPEIAKLLADKIIMDLNSFAREREIILAKNSILFLEAQLEQKSTATVVDAISSLIEREFKKLMLAEVNLDYAFRIIDSPRVPTERSKPRRSLYASLGAFFGFFACLLVFFIKRKFN
tara:strand:- start:828 stop:1601 length:774 start_codon:yes stop_codon:yes gene_type:complete